ncbi:MAG: hypothetical protein WAN65_32350 [Candidatus Sulfotelmatobacter sp.]
MTGAIFRRLTIALCMGIATGVLFEPLACAAQSSPQTEQANFPGASSRRIGAIKSIKGTSITLTDSGTDVNVTVQPATRIVRIAPGEKDLKNSTPIQLQDLQVGDRILVAGKTSGDNQSLTASTVVVMKSSDVETLHQHELQDWQKRGVDGLATAVDTAAGTVTISARGKRLVIHSSQTTVIRRYVPDSVRFEDAKASTLQEVHSGDQVRARGKRSADGTELQAEEIVSGSFPSIAGTINSVDASSSTLSVHDLVGKKTVVVKIALDSQLRNLPPEMAQRIAMVLKGAAMGSQPGAAGSSASALGETPHTVSPVSGTGAGASGMGSGGRSGGGPDFQRLLTRAPATSLTDLHKGDAVLILSTAGSAGVGTVITLLSGVEPILRAAPGASSASLLTPWSLSAPSGDAGGP